MARVHVFIRLALFLAVATIGCSSVYWLLYLALPALAALMISQEGGNRYLSEDGPRVVRVLRWLAAAYGYLWLLTDAVPTNAAGGPVDLEVELEGNPTVASSLLRLLYSLPAVVLLAVLSLVAGLFWIVAAVCILVRERVPEAVFDLLALTLRLQFRLFAYHLSLVERYPSLEGSRMAHAAT